MLIAFVIFIGFAASLAISIGIRLVQQWSRMVDIGETPVIPGLSPDIAPEAKNAASIVPTQEKP